LLFLRLLHAFFEQFFHHGDGFRMFGIVCVVFVFLRVFRSISKFPQKS
jgi:hypothetical protein